MSGMMNDRFPWEIDAPLRPERLQLLAVGALKARHQVIDLRVEGRDDAWCTGCRAYSWTCSTFAGLAKTEEHKVWLRTTRSGLTFTLYIGDVPVKFYRGKAEDPKANTLRSGVRAMLQQERLAFLEDEISSETEGWFWLLAIDTDYDGRVLEVIAMQANAQGETRYSWSIPLDGRVVALADVTDVRREGVDLPEPHIGLLGDEDKQATQRDGDKDHGDEG